MPSVGRRCAPALRHALPPPDGSPPWFEAEADPGHPLRWHLPLLVLAEAAGHDTAADGPWRLTLRFRAYPAYAPSLLPWHGPHPDRASFFNAAKEAAACVAGGGAARLTALAPGAADALWAAAEAGDAAAAADAFADAGVGAATDRVPLRVVLAARGRVAAALSAPAHARASLADAVLALLAQSGASDDREWALADGTLTRRGRAVRVRAAGVDAPLGSPLAPLHAALRAPDGFLYVDLMAEGGGWA